MLKLLRAEDLTHVAVAFDRTAPPAKGDRSPDALLRSQQDLVCDVVRALGMALWPMIRLQADDALATAAARYGDEVDRLVLCTRDKDLWQCVRGDRIVLLDRTKGVVVDEAAVRARYGVGPEQVPDVHALVGDPSDGLPGVPGWGAKATAAVLARYGRLEDIPDDGWDVAVRGAERLATSLRERRDEARLFKALATLRTDVPLPHRLADLAWRGPRPEIHDVAARLGAVEALEGLPTRG
jgi:5'-3' exonuclease